MIDELKSYGDIKSSIKDQIGKRDMIKKEIDELGKQKQEISLQCQNGISFINEINNKMFYFKAMMDHYNKDIDNKIKSSSRVSMPSSIFIIYNNTEKKKMTRKQKKTETVKMYYNTYNRNTLQMILFLKE